MEGLPVMDGKVGMGIATVKKAGTDAFCKYSFAGGKPIKTKVVTRQGTNRTEINPEFNYELWYPVSVPTMTQVCINVAISFYFLRCTPTFEYNLFASLLPIELLFFS